MLRGLIALAAALALALLLQRGQPAEARNAVDASVQIAAGPFHLCALRLDGTVWCCGEGSLGQLGNGGNENSNTAVQVKGIDDAIAIAAGGDPAPLSRGHTCALLRDGSVKCWGSNSLGQLGDGAEKDSNVPVLVSGGGTYKQIAAGNVHVCALRFSGQPSCWGANHGGQLGLGHSDTPQHTPAPMTGDLAKEVRQIATGAVFTCGLLMSGKAYCTGVDFDGRLGDGGGIGHTSTPVQVSGLENATSLALASKHACARLANGSVRCWGGNLDGQLGTGNNSQLNAPGASVSGLANTWTIGGGAISTHQCAVDANTDVWCWGNDASGQLGNFASGDSNVPVEVQSDDGGLNTIVAVTQGAGFSCALGSLGEIWCWGDNEFGQLGDGTNTDSNVAVLALGPDPAQGQGGDDFFGTTQLGLGSNHGCALPPYSRAQCWGRNLEGQLGDGTTDSRLSPALSGSSPPTSITGGGNHTCQVDLGGRVSCWGHNSNGQLGNSSTSPSLDAVAVTGLDGVIALSAGFFHTCALKADGTIWCWGQNGIGTSGRLGDGTVMQRTAPVQAQGITNAIAVTAGSAHTCAVLATGAAQCWGNNQAGQLGNGLTTGTTTPALVTGVSSALDIAAGSAHTCALLVDGDVKCWGANNGGQLGTGNNNPSLTPVSVSGIGDAIDARSIAVTSASACGLLETGLVACWGANGSGQLGDGTTDNRNAPVYALIESASAIDTHIGPYTCAIGELGVVHCWGEGSLTGDGTDAERDAPVPTGLDSDTDSCADTEERNEDPPHGGDRSHVYQWDYFDANFDGAVDVADVVAILGSFGSSPGGANYRPWLDRFAPNPSKLYRTALATQPADLGIDVADAILNLQSFGHSCANPP